ncbi:nucleotidyltransferase family protein [Candidatus Bipolaricaulota bacterium]|nr:nucleotidyltransferase family protein [Candidatus Bipolaricaulota bacterium]
MIRPIVFAAGLGTRMGTIKALMPINGDPAICVVLRTIEAAHLKSPILVLGRDAQAIRDRVDVEDCHIVINNDPERGLSESMKLALDALSDTDTGILTFLVDMPYVARSTVQKVLEAIGEGATLAAPFHESVRGFPVFFHRRFFRPLRESLQGDSGGRPFLANHEEDLIHVPVEDPGCVFDIDRPADLRAWKGVHLCATNE